MAEVRRARYWDRSLQHFSNDFSKAIDPDYPDTRVVHVKIVDGKFVTVLPPVRFRPTETSAVHATTSVRPTRDDRSNVHQISPVLLICRRLIEVAVHDAIEFTREIRLSDDDVGYNAR